MAVMTVGEEFSLSFSLREWCSDASFLPEDACFAMFSINDRVAVDFDFLGFLVLLALLWPSHKTLDSESSMVGSYLSLDFLEGDVAVVVLVLVPDGGSCSWYRERGGGASLARLMAWSDMELRVFFF